MLQLNRKLNNKGRNVTLRMDAKYTDKDSKSISCRMPIFIWYRLLQVWIPHIRPTAII